MDTKFTTKIFVFMMFIYGMFSGSSTEKLNAFCEMKYLTILDYYFWVMVCSMRLGHFLVYANTSLLVFQNS